MLKKYKSYNFKFVSILFFTLILIVLLSIITDPFKVFNAPLIKHFNYIKPDVDRNQRVTKIVSLKLDKSPIDSVFLGSSRVNSSISEEFYKEITNGKITKNLGMNALSHDETFKVARNAVLIHPEIKTIYVGLDFFRFLQKNKDDKRAVVLSDNPKLTISEFNPLILSFNTIIAVFNTISVNIRSKENKLNKDKTDAFKRIIKSYSENYDDAVFAEEEIDKLTNFQDEMQQKGYKVVFYTNPTHAIDMAIIDKIGAMHAFNQWKYSLAAHLDYIDFDFINDLTSEKVGCDTKYFKESSHATYEMGKIILENLIFGNNLYGIKTNKQNVKNNEMHNMLGLKKWEEENQSWMTIIQETLDERKAEKNAV